MERSYRKAFFNEHSFDWWQKLSETLMEENHQKVSKKIGSTFDWENYLSNITTQTQNWSLYQMPDT